RQYAAEGLQASGEAETIRTRHQDWFLFWAEAARPQLQGADQGDWLARLELEHANLRQALRGCLEEEDRYQSGLRLGAALQGFWQIRGHLSEGQEYLTALLARPGAQSRTAARADALNGAGRLAFDLGDYASSRALHEEGLAIYRELGDQIEIA